MRQRLFPLAALLLSATAAATAATAQTCTTQSGLVNDARQALVDRSLELASAIKAGDSAKVQSLSSQDIASNFGQTGYLVRTLSENLQGDTLQVTQLYQLDANARKPGDSSEADFSCSLKNSESETDFAIGGLPPGLYAFTMVEAQSGPRPWLLSFLLRQDAGVWKMAGFYPHARTAAGHDGLWYWREARDKAKAGDHWLAWLDYAEADNLLRPANFVTSTNLDKLRTERGQAAPPELRDGVSADTPYTLTAAGTTFPITSLEPAASPDGQRLMLVVHFRATALTDVAAERARNLALAKALVAAHPGLRTGFAGLTVFADTSSQSPFATDIAMTEIR